MRALESFIVAVMLCAALTVAYLYFVSPGYTAQYQSYATAKTAIRQAEERTQQVQAQEWGDTLRMWGMWGGGGLAAVGGLAVIAWAVVEWQRNRTKRHEVTEDHTTQRHLISAKKDIVLAYLVQFGEPGAQPMVLNGVRGAYLPSTNEFVPEDICRAELATAQTTALARRAAQTINVPAAQQERRFLVVGEREEW